MKLLVIAVLLATTTSASEPRDLFTDASALELRLEAPFTRLFALSRQSPTTDVAVDGSLSYTDPANGRSVAVGPVKVSVRGHTSRRDTECSFPKLRIDFDRRSVPASTLFVGLHSVKIGTHCADRPDGQLTKLGRWANEKSPIREALTYRLLGAAGVRTLRARPARITYVDGAHTFSRGAMLLEDDHDAIRRLGGTGELRGFRSARDDFRVDDAASLAFGEAMIGNFDWALRFSPDDYYRVDHTHPLWNVLAVRRADGTAFPVMFDFDLAGTVTGKHPWFPRVYLDALLPSRSHSDIETLGQVQRTRTLFSRDVLDRVRRRFLDARSAVYHALDEGVVDDEGRRFARAYLDGFYRAIDGDHAFYRPVVVNGNALPYASPTGEAGVCGRDDRIPIGTGVGDPLGENGSRVRVVLLDVWWHWASRCDAVHEAAVWVDASAISRDFPPSHHAAGR